MHKYTPEEVEFITNNFKGRGNDELTAMFNNEFGTRLTVSQIKGFKKNNRLSSGLDGCFNKGHIPFNKGKKGISFGGKTTQFKKGHRPINWVPIGTERVIEGGYIQIKIQEGQFQKNWKFKHILIWEKHNGPLPKGYAVIFGDGNNRNFDIDNLILVSRKQLLVLNRKKLIQNDADLTRTGVIIADLYSKISEKNKLRRD